MEMPKSLGLTGTEFEVYTALLKNGKSLANELIRKLQLHRATVYDVLARLEEKGLASHMIQDNKKYFLAAKPETFIDILHEKKKEIEESIEETKEAIKKLPKAELKEEKGQVAEIYTGIEGLKRLMQDLLGEKEFLVMGGEVKFNELLPAYTKHWAKEREEKGVYAKILTTKPITQDWKYNSAKQVPTTLQLPTPTIIYGNKVAIILYKQEPLTIILLSNKEVAATYRNHFNLLWGTLK